MNIKIILEQIAELAESAVGFLDSRESAKIINFETMRELNRPKDTKNSSVNKTTKKTYGKGSICKRSRTNKDGTVYVWYQARFYDKDGMQHSITAKSEKEARDKLNLALKKPNLLNIYNLKTWFYVWRKTYKENFVKNSTLHSLDLIINKYLLTNDICKIDLRKLKPMDLQKFLNSIEYPRQREHLYIHLKDMLNKAMLNNIISSNPMDLVEIKKHQKKQSKVLTKDEQKIFVNACRNNKYGNYYLILLYTGMRRGELLALEKNDIDFQNNTITISKTLNGLNEISSTKNGKSRVIPILDLAIAPLKTAISNTNTTRLFNVTEGPVTQHFAKLKKEINIEDITMHSLRHTFATNCLEAGIPAKQVQSWLGHSSIDVTLDIYSHISKSFENENVKKLENYLYTD